MPYVSVALAQLHKISCAKYNQQRDDLRILTWQHQLPLSFTQHLLVPRSPWTARLKKYFCGLPSSFDFLSFEGTGCQHLFVDGSCIHHGPCRIPTAAWAVCNSTTGHTLACAPLAGLPQSIGRAEITAFIAAVQWAIVTGLDIHIWCDSLFLVRRVQLLLQDPFAHSVQTMENHDLFE